MIPTVEFAIYGREDLQSDAWEAIMDKSIRENIEYNREEGWNFKLTHMKPCRVYNLCPTRIRI